MKSRTVKKCAFVFFMLFGFVCRGQQLPAGMPARGLIGWYPFSGDATDESGNANDGEILGDVKPTTDRFGNASSAYSFAGKPHSEIIIVMKTPVTLTSRSYSCWIKFPVEAKNWYPSVFSRLPGGDYAHILGDHPNYINANGVGKLYWSWIPGKEGVLSKTFFNDNKWHHVVMVANYETSTYRIYTDGRLDNETTASNTQLTVDSFAIGYQNGDNPWSSCVGALDDFGIYDRPLSEKEVLQLYKATALVKKAPAQTQEAKESDYRVAADAEREELTVTITSGTYDSYVITDKDGKVLMKQFIKSAQIRIDISMLAPGAYNLTLEKDGKGKTVTFVKREQGVLK